MKKLKIRNKSKYSKYKNQNTDVVFGVLEFGFVSDFGF
jgi:hypothetical protein